MSAIFLAGRFSHRPVGFIGHRRNSVSHEISATVFLDSWKVVRMKRFESAYKRAIFLALLFVIGVASGEIEKVSAAVASGDSIASRALAGAVKEPTVTSSSPDNWATKVPTSINTGENVLTGTVVTATFSQPMDPATLNSPTAESLPTFTVKETAGNEVPGSVVMNAANTVATFTPTSSALAPNTTYVATVTTAAKSATGVAIAHPITWRFTTNAVALTGQSPVPLGEAGIFAILTKAGVTDVPPSSVTGDVGASPITGAAIHLTCAEMVTGTIYSVNAAGPLPCRVTDPTLLTTAVANMQTAYTNAAGRTNPNFTNLGAGQIGGLTLAPGLYKWTTGVLMSSNVTLSGSANDVWIFQIAGTLTQANATKMILAGGALPKNIFWQSSGAVSIGTTARFEGVMLGKTMIALKTSASANGRLFAQTAVTLQQNAVTAP
jgi:hypothetical protein